MFSRTKFILCGSLALGGVGVLGCQSDDHHRDRTSSTTDIKQGKDVGPYGGDGRGRNETTAGYDRSRTAGDVEVRRDADLSTGGIRPEDRRYEDAGTPRDIKQGKDAGYYGGDGKGTNETTSGYDRTSTGAGVRPRADVRPNAGSITDTGTGTGVGVRREADPRTSDGRPNVRTYEEAGTPNDIKQGKDAGHYGGDGLGNIRPDNPDR